MLSLFIDDAGSLLPRHISNFLVYGAFVIPTQDIKRLRNKVKKVLAIIKEPEIKSPYIETHFPKLIKDIDYIWPQGIKSDCFFVIIDKRELMKRGFKFNKDMNHEIYAYGIWLITKFFSDKFKCGFEVTFDQCLKESAKVLAILNSYYKTEAGITYNYDDSRHEHGIQIAHCISNLFLNHHEKLIILPPFLKNAHKNYFDKIKQSSKELSNFTESLMVSRTMQ